MLLSSIGLRRSSAPYGNACVERDRPFPHMPSNALNDAILNAAILHVVKNRCCPCRKPNPAGKCGRIAQCFRLMIEACSLVWSMLVLSFRSRATLEAEILILRHQLNIQRRHLPKRLTFSAMDRLIFAGLYRLVPSILNALTIVKPETVVRWHRAGFRSYWCWESQPRGGRPIVPPEIRRLIREMSMANPLWGAPRIHGELLKLGIEIGQTSVAKYMARRRGPPSQGWKTFLGNHSS